VGNKWLQDKISCYFAWKVKRGLKALKHQEQMKQLLEILKGDL
jgi:hypothetical protein